MTMPSVGSGCTVKRNNQMRDMMKLGKRPRQEGMWNLIVLGLISCFSDISSEMVYPLIPLYLTAEFGATPAMIGIVEGFAESVAGLLKVFSGYLSDRFQQKKALAFGGYAAGVLYKIALLFAGSWTGILGARVIDRFGKGVRTAPRDAMVAESAGESGMGRAFGIHKMLDMAGSAIGILLAFILVRHVGSDGHRTVFAVSHHSRSPFLFCYFFWSMKKRGDTRPRQGNAFGEISPGWMDGLSFISPSPFSLLWETHPTAFCCCVLPTSVLMAVIRSCFIFCTM